MVLAENFFFADTGFLTLLFLLDLLRRCVVKLN